MKARGLEVQNFASHIHFCVTKVTNSVETGGKQVMEIGLQRYLFRVFYVSAATSHSGVIRGNSIPGYRRSFRAAELSLV